MKRFLITTLLTAAVALPALGMENYYQRPLSCPLRFSDLTDLRNQIQLITASLGNDCSRSSQAAINQMSSRINNLEGIVTSYNTVRGEDQNATNSQYAKNLNSILGSLNIITSNTACFYDLKSRGALPVISDVIMSISQLGLLIPDTTGIAVSAGGYLIGSGLKIINELINNRYNFKLPEDRRSFIQLNCAFFDNRRMIDEAGIFNPASEEIRSDMLRQLRFERSQLIKEQRSKAAELKFVQDNLFRSISMLPGAAQKNLDPLLAKRLDDLAASLSNKPADYATKWIQVTHLAQVAEDILKRLDGLKLEDKNANAMIGLLASNLAKVLPTLSPEGQAWNASIDEWEMMYRGPIMAFLNPVSLSLKNDIANLEVDVSVATPLMAVDMSKQRKKIKEINLASWAINQRIASLDSKIARLDGINSGIFSDVDTGTTNEVEILEYFRKLQKSILGKEGKGYLSNAIKVGYDMGEAVDMQLSKFSEAENQRQKCAAAERLRFAWTQFRLKIQEASDFVSTNEDLARLKFQVGKEKLKGDTKFVILQMESAAAFKRGETPMRNSVGELMTLVEAKLKVVEPKLQESACF